MALASMYGLQANKILGPSFTSQCSIHGLQRVRAEKPLPGTGWRKDGLQCIDWLACSERRRLNFVTILPRRYLQRTGNSYKNISVGRWMERERDGGDKVPNGPEFGGDLDVTMSNPLARSTSTSLLVKESREQFQLARALGLYQCHSGLPPALLLFRLAERVLHWSSTVEG
jgi:hypothetical protein